MRASRQQIVVPPNSDIHPVDCHVGRQIRLLRIQCNLSQGDLGNRIGISYQQMQKYETGKNRVSASMLYEIARALQVSPARFFEGLPEPGTEYIHAAAVEIEKRLANLAPTDGQQVIENMLNLSLRLHNRLLAIAGILANEQSDVQAPDT